MMESRNPLEVARATLQQISLHKLAPTPANYQACYNEIAGIPNVAGFPEVPLRRIANALPARTAQQREALDRFETAIGRRSWQELQDALIAFAVHADREDVAADQAPADPPRLIGELLARLTRLIEILVAAVGDDDSRWSGQGIELLAALAAPEVDMAGLLPLLTSFAQRLALATEQQGEIRLTLLKLLHLIIENIGDLALDEQCISGQVDALLRAASPPLSLRRLDDLERRLQEVIVRQRAARGRCLEAQEAMRLMLAAFIAQLAETNSSSAHFQSRLEESAERIAQARTIEDLAPLLKQVIEATRAMAEETGGARDRLEQLQARVTAADAELASLHEDLHHASASARHDPLTDTLNRRGLDEALAREIAAFRRNEAPLSVSLLDVDNFKKLNDRLGHATGDEALIHLADIARRHMRPIDTLARYGGEEFVILMPDTALDEGIDAMKRLQRELTRNFFLAGNEKILITFSAGVAELIAEESGENAIERADQAMYLAKRAGKNLVMGA